MRLMSKKTWSQQQLAVKLRVAPPPNQGLFTWERRRLLIHAAKTALAAALCWWLARLFGLHDGYWGSISAIIVLQSNFGATISASRDRILGTLIGALFGFPFSLFGLLPWNYIAAVLLAILVCGLFGLRNSSRLAGVTITIIMLVQNLAPAGALPSIASAKSSSASSSQSPSPPSFSLIAHDSACATAWRRSSSSSVHFLKPSSRAFAVFPLPISPRSAKMPSPCSAATTNS